VSTKAAIEDPEPDYKYLRREADKVRQDKAVFNRQEMLTNIFKR
jgi:hypothetical protein